MRPSRPAAGSTFVLTVRPGYSRRRGCLGTSVRPPISPCFSVIARLALTPAPQAGATYRSSRPNDYEKNPAYPSASFNTPRYRTLDYVSASRTSRRSTSKPYSNSLDSFYFYSTRISILRKPASVSSYIDPANGSLAAISCAYKVTSFVAQTDSLAFIKYRSRQQP